MDADVYNQVKVSIKKLLDIDLNHYKDEQMKRRLDSWLVRSRKPNWSDYLQFASSDSDEIKRFRNYLTINVTEFFRDPDRWNTLRRDVLPKLLRNNQQNGARGGLRVWSAGCSVGVEAYSLSMLLDEEVPLSAPYLLATDLDRGAIKKALDHGPYNADEIKNLSAGQRSKYIQEQQGYYVKENAARRVTFKEQNLLEDRFENEFDLIVCRNVVIYFTSDAKNLLYAKFHAALKPGGILFVGGTEIIPRPLEIGFKNFGISFYEKVNGGSI